MTRSSKRRSYRAVLHCCPGGINKLYLVLQDEGVLNYVKYLSYSAPSSRFDINGVFEFYYMNSNVQCDDEEGDDAMGEDCEGNDGSDGSDE